MAPKKKTKESEKRRKEEEARLAEGVQELCCSLACTCRQRQHGPTAAALSPQRNA